MTGTQPTTDQPTTDRPLWAREFGDKARVPSSVVRGLIDISWHNDVMPSFIHPDHDNPFFSGDGKEIRLWIDFANPADREEPKNYRYGVFEHGENACLYEGESGRAARRAFNAAVAASLTPTVRLAILFDNALRAEILDNYIIACARNGRDKDGRFCASHDFCDANMVMLPCWQRVTKRRRFVPDVSDDALWNAAWDLWRSRTATTPMFVVETLDSTYLGSDSRSWPVLTVRTTTLDLATRFPTVEHAEEWIASHHVHREDVEIRDIADIERKF